MTRSVLQIAAVVLILVAAFVVFMYFEIQSISRAVPPTHVVTFDDFLDWTGDVKGFWTIRNRRDPKQEFVAAYTTSPASWPSGPPVYVFDRQGALIEWTTDCGDDQRFQETWNWFDSPELTENDVRAWFQKRAANDADQAQRSGAGDD